MECSDGSGISSRVYNGREDGVMGSLAARRVAQSDRAGVWEAVIVDLFPGVAIRCDSSSSSASLAVGADAFGTRGDTERHRRMTWPGPEPVARNAVSWRPMPGCDRRWPAS